MFLHSLNTRFGSTFPLPFALCLTVTQNEIYTGLRNGGILRFDARVQRSNSFPLFNSISQRTSSITGLKHLRDHQLLVGFLDGGVSVPGSRCDAGAEGEFRYQRLIYVSPSGRH